MATVPPNNVQTGTPLGNIDFSDSQNAKLVDDVMREAETMSSVNEDMPPQQQMMRQQPPQQQSQMYPPQQQMPQHMMQSQPQMMHPQQQQMYPPHMMQSQMYPPHMMQPQMSQKEHFEQKETKGDFMSNLFKNLKNMAIVFVIMIVFQIPAVKNLFTKIPFTLTAEGQPTFLLSLLTVFAGSIIYFLVFSVFAL